tara:strand:+ start:712 stop:1284 length:573 start_codon:yes stop_codon:yes gene_type:complete
MYTINGDYIEIRNSSRKEKIIENMDNATASFNTLQFHDTKNKPASLTYSGNKIILSQEKEDNSLSTMLDVDFAKQTVGVYSNFNIQDNLIFYPDSKDNKQEVDKGLIFFNKNRKAVASIHKDSKDKSDLVFRTGYSNESAFDLTERMRIKNSENRVKISGSLDAEELCLGDVCLDKKDIEWIKSRGNIKK